MDPSVTRRRTLAALVALPSAALAGCTGQPADGGGGPAGDTTADDGTDTATGDPTTDADADATVTTTDSGELDLREANVTGVSVENTGDRSFRFDVTLIHDDDGEDGYANWWQVERLDGDRLGRRELLHAHGTREFTRSETIEVPEGGDCVVVRGHDQTHGYGGQAAVVGLGGTVSLRRQGSEPATFGPADCP
jgi:hypothetical protein